MKKKNRRRIWIILSLALLVIAVGGGWFIQQRARAAGNSEAGDVVTAFIGDLSASASASGTLLPEQDANIALGTSGVVKHVYVRAGDQVKTGDVLVELESDSLARAIESAQQSLAIQEANLAELLKAPEARDIKTLEMQVANAQASLDDLLSGPSKAELTQAEASVESAQARLDDLLTGPSDEELAQAYTAVTSAKAALEAAQARYEALDDQLVVAQNSIDSAQLMVDQTTDMYNLLVWNNWQASTSWAPYSPQGIALDQAKINYAAAVANYELTQIDVNNAAVKSAQTQLAQAQTSLASLTEDKTVEIASAESQLARAKATLATLTGDKSVQIAAAEAQLLQTQASLAKLLDGASNEQIAISEAQVEQARISLAEAEANLDNAKLTAPFDGTVTDVYVAMGEQASGPAVQLVDTDSLQVVLNVDEIDIGTIEVGQETIVTLETWPEQKLNATVVAIAPEARVLSGIVTFEVRLDIDAQDLPVRTGMSANAEMITAQRENVLLVPNRAIIADRENGTYYVNRIQGEEIVKVEVTIGLRDTLYTEITSGLEAGAKLSLSGVEETVAFGPPGMR